MLLTFKTVNHETFTVDVESTDKVLNVKEKIFTARGNKFPVECQKLIYGGSILSDDSLIGDANIDPKKFVVVMISRPKKTDATSSSSGGDLDSTSARNASGTAESGGAQQTAATVDSLATSRNLDEHVINEIVSMGYPRNQALEALRLAGGDPDRAVNILLNGGVEDVSEENLSGEDLHDEGEAQEEDDENPFAQLREDPQFMLCQAAFQLNPNPEMLQSIMQTMQQQFGPEIIQLINEHQQEFIDLLQEPVEIPEGGNEAEDSEPGEQGAAGIELTPSDQEAIERIKGMGFDEESVIEAYFACDKNEIAAVNFLLQDPDQI